MSKEIVRDVIQKWGADIYSYNGPVTRTNAYSFYENVTGNKSKENKTVILFLKTDGGDADAAYIISRTLQSYYTKVIVAVSERCKSAGTIIAISAHQLFMAGLAEFGPLDVQMLKDDEIQARSSALNVMHGLSSTTAMAFKAFEDFFLDLVSKSGGGISTKTAADIASHLASELYKPITQQIDPVKLGETMRSIEIAKAYGEKLERVSKNLHEGALNRLISGYPSHSYVIDFFEAGEIFKSVSPMDDSFLAIGKLLLEQEGIFCLNKVFEYNHEKPNDTSANQNINDHRGNDPQADAVNTHDSSGDKQEDKREHG